MVDAEQVQPVHGLHLAVPDRLASTTGARCRASQAYSVEEQLGWDELPAELSADAAGRRTASPADAPPAIVPAAPPLPAAASGEAAVQRAPRTAPTLPPWSAAHAYTNLYGPKAAEKSVTATVVGNVRVTEVGTRVRHPPHRARLRRHAVPGARRPVASASCRRASTRRAGRTTRASTRIASPRNGERPGYNNLSLTIKRVLEDHQGKPVRGVASNYMCDLKVGDKVQVIGPFGTSFLMPNHPKSHIVMICTGTGSAPMRAMTEWRRRLRAAGKFEGGKLMLFFGARTQGGAALLRPAAEPAQGLHRHQLRLLRTPGQPKRYVQDLMRERAADLGRAARPTRTPTSTSAA